MEQNDNEKGLVLVAQNQKAAIDANLFNRVLPRGDYVAQVEASDVIWKEVLSGRETSRICCCGSCAGTSGAFTKRPSSFAFTTWTRTSRNATVRRWVIWVSPWACTASTISINCMASRSR